MPVDICETELPALVSVGEPFVIKAGMTHGATDEMGFHVVQDEVHVHDLQATILHCLGFDHERLTYTYQGRQFRLTDVHGHVVEKILT